MESSDQIPKEAAQKLKAERIDLIVNESMTLAGFHSLDLLAEGATGVVYAALSDDTNSEVAIKIYKKELIADSDASKRFQREVLALSHITHPNIVRIISSGETASGQAFIVMDLLDGMSIRTILETEGVLSRLAPSK